MNYIFDFDGTIIDSLPAFIAVFNKNIRGNDDPLSFEEIQAFRNMSSRKAIKNAGVRWWQIPKLLFQGIPDFHALIPTLDPCVGVPEILKALHERGDKLFIVTSNTREIVDQFLETQYLSQYFTDIATGASLFKKSKFIRRLMKANGLKRKESVYIGDETRDVQAARLALIKVVSVTWGFNTRRILLKQRPTFIIDSPHELLAINLKQRKPHATT